MFFAATVTWRGVPRDFLYGRHKIGCSHKVNCIFVAVSFAVRGVKNNLVKIHIAVCPKLSQSIENGKSEFTVSYPKWMQAAEDAAPNGA
jgi:hypothetical protein